jgi:hypothetical protein
MSTSINAVILALDEFVPDDFGNDAKLYEIFEGFESFPSRELTIDSMLGLIERFPDADLGSPGPLVHELEAIPGYEPFLLQSLRRQPADLTVWMANRILNTELPTEVRTAWLNELRMVLKNPKAKESTRDAANEFLEFQDA